MELTDQVEPVAKVNIQGNSADTVLWMWEHLVPFYAAPTSLQGEIIRVLELLAWEAQANSNLNWDDSFDEMLIFLRKAFISAEFPLAQHFSIETRLSIEADINRLANFVLPTELDSRIFSEEQPYIKDDLYDRLAGYLVDYCRAYPQIIPYHNVSG
ncbi:hypothetical protein TUM4438_25010 [Shewanella sairae]|uniref:Uncharacterized protein n=1 Tax=Shewanella sairae TaxID=190310 RepID=A0ABQ4PHZ9_9GAMM|nr:hypothetical protein [Shewanella sairae]MCL1131336.1 hypothetical protein [Shewanella sairae]GIU47084.1 hypothetical protein TUM4438_25010 [Shewanella sairae]